MKLEAGKVYVTRKGEVVGPLENFIHPSYPFSVRENGVPVLWTESGSYWISGEENPNDIISKLAP